MGVVDDSHQPDLGASARRMVAERESTRALSTEALEQGVIVDAFILIKRLAGFRMVHAPIAVRARLDEILDEAVELMRRVET